MYFSNLKPHDVANGVGVRVSLFCSGCEHACPGCFNPEAWQFNFGKPFTGEVEQQIIDALKPDYIRGLTLLGGEPLHPRNRPAIQALVERVRSEFPGKDIWCYTGFQFEHELLPNPDIHPLLAQIDVLVEGRFIQALKSFNTPFRGSSNQRVLLCSKSVKAGYAVLAKEFN
jgi:anaerobic ribonucleoside-triphosphate reductase activating protein